jgi:glycosyltransferase involved in cell wall biosynthesis
LGIFDMSLPVIAHLLPSYNPFPPSYAAGTELRVEQVALRQQRYSPLVICGAFPGQELTEQVKGMLIRRVHIGRVYRRLFQKITDLDPWPYTARMWQILRSERARILHIHNEPKLLSGLGKHLIKASLPVVMHVANEKPIPRQFIHLVSRWVACSQYIKKWLAGADGIQPEGIDVIYTGVDVETRLPWWDFPPAQRKALRDRFGIRDDDAIVILFAGRLVREKGVSEILEAFRALRPLCKKTVYLVVAGNVRESDDPRNEKATYGRAVVKQMAGEQRVKWVGSLSPNEVHGFLTSGDIFVLPSLWPDPFPTVMLEAAAAGLPILANDRGGIGEFLEGCPGVPMIREPGNLELWVEQLTQLIGDMDLRRRAGQWLRDRVVRSFGWTRVTQEFEDLYDRILGRV